MKSGFFASVAAGVWVVAGWLALCSVAQAETAPVMVSVKPLAMMYLALRPQQSVDILLPADRDLHDYSMSVDDIQRVQQASALFWLGPNSEPFLQALAQRFAVRNHWTAVAGNTRHAWLDQQQIAVLISNMANALEKQFPAEAELIAQREQTLITNINQRFQYWQQQLQPYANSPFLLGHDAFLPFAGNVGLQQAVMYRAANDHGHVQAGMQELLAIQQRITQRNIRCALEEPEVSFAALSQRYPSLRLGQLDPLGATIPLSENAYITFIDASARAFLACLKGK